MDRRRLNSRPPGRTAGGLGFVAAGYLTAEVFAERLAAARGLTSGPIGANLFAPQPSAGTPADIERYAKALAPEAEALRRPAR